MKRFLEDKLIAWKDSKSRKPLVLRGARQVGKTFSVKEFGKSYFSSLATIDFERNISARAIFDQDLDARRLIAELEVFLGQSILPGQTLLFFDEVQTCERAMMMLRYFFEEMPDLHVIAAGSLLEFAMSEASFPVGRVTFEWMRPMTYKEFLLANGKSILAENIPSLFSEKPISKTLHGKLMEELRRYAIVGGMPEAVKTYMENASFVNVKKVQDDIIHSYLESLVKYNKKANVESLEHLVKSIPSKIGSQIKFSSLDPGRRSEITKSSLNTLEKALLVNIIQSTNIAGLPLGANASASIFKLLFLDIGLLQNICGINPLEILNTTDLTSEYKGIIAEQLVGQELLASGGSENLKLYYWNRMKKGSTAEVDYVIVRNGQIYPLEVKNGPAGKLRSMHQLLIDYPTIEKGFVLSSGFFEKLSVSKLHFKPIYSLLE